MTLSYNKFVVSALDGCCGHSEPPDLYCTVCGKSVGAVLDMRLDEVIGLAEDHECAPLAVTEA